MLTALADQQQAVSQFQDGFGYQQPASSTASLPSLTLSNVNFVNKADPLVIKLKIARTPVDISIGQLGGLFTLDFIQEFA